jgi:hypothetical protein
MGDTLLGIGVVLGAAAGWFALSKWVLPMLGVAT